jgi:hypothetical protein
MSQELTGVHANETHPTAELRSVSETLAELARINGAADGGVTRVVWSPELHAPSSVEE